MKYLLCAVLVTVAVVAAERRRYDGYEEWEVIVGHKQQADVLNRLEEEGRIDILKAPAPGQRGVVLVAPEVKTSLMSTLLVSGIRTRVIDNDIQKKIDLQYEAIDSHKEDTFAFGLNNYNTFEDLMSQIKVWVSKCPSGLECSSYSIGKSYEGRDMTVLKIKKAGSSNKALWFEFTIHAREWLSTTTGQNLIHTIISNYSSDSDVKDLADNYDIYILLVANPDGYVYTFTNERMWRKSRNVNAGSSCKGTDLNRNYDVEWGKQGVSKSPCVSMYCGSGPASEIEVKNMQAEIKRIKATTIATYAVHCCAKMWMFPYGYTEDFSIWSKCKLTKDDADLAQAAKAGVDAVEKESGVRWASGTICKTIYPITGSTSDYSYVKQGIKYSWAIEVAGWFTDPETKIAPVFQQFWLALVASTNEIEKIEGL